MTSANRARLTQFSEISARQRLRMKSASPSRCDIGAATARLADEVLTGPNGGDRSAALDHMRQRLHASEALLWLCNDERAVCVLDEGGEQALFSRSVRLEDGAVTRRLRFSGTALCQVDEVSGLECLVPAGLRSYAAAAAPSGGGATAVLIVGWPDSSIPCTQGDAVHFRIAVALLANGLDGFAAASVKPDLADAILGTLSERIAVVDRQGAILAVNGAWTDFGERHGVSGQGVIGPGANYLEVCRRAAAAGCDDAREALAGIDAIWSGSAESFAMAYSGGIPGEDDWWVMKVKPLHRPGGGAVIVHSQITHADMMQVAQRIATGQFHRFLDSLPMPIWVAEPDGRLIFGNQQWMDATRGHEPGNGTWTSAYHPNDRPHATEAFRAAVDRAEPLDIEARLMNADGVWRWAACRAAPQHSPDGGIVNYVGACWDTTAKRRMESSLRQLAGKLVAAQEAERTRIGRELHDDLGQQLAVLALRVDALSRERQMARLRRGVMEAHTVLQEIVSSVQALSHQLHPAKLRFLGLVRTLETLCQELSAESGIRIQWDTRGVRPDVDDDIGLCVFRVAQEALRNAVKHSGASAIDVSLVATVSIMTLRVSDNGAGFDPLTSPAAGLGLQTMRERVDLVGGVLAVEAVRPHGTTVRVDIPLRGHPAPGDGETSEEFTSVARA
jgi:PAS domain S-box-containing protein